MLPSRSRSVDSLTVVKVAALGGEEEQDSQEVGDQHDVKSLPAAGDTMLLLLFVTSRVFED